MKETQGELRHVAWPTRAQTIVYTVLVALISVGIALYLGLFDYLFTTGLAKAVGVLPTTPTQTQQIQQSQEATSAPQVDFSVPGTSGTTKTQ